VGWVGAVTEGVCLVGQIVHRMIGACWFTLFRVSGDLWAGASLCRRTGRRRISPSCSLVAIRVFCAVQVYVAFSE